MSTTDNVQAAIDAGIQIGSVAPTELERGKLYAIRNEDGVPEILDTRKDEFLDEPLRKTAKPIVRDSASFLAYWNKHKVPSSEVFTDLDTQEVVAVIDAHGPAADALHGFTDWGEHRLTLKVRKTEQWKAWEKLDRRMLLQVDFAEHIEDRLEDIEAPPAAEMLELAMSFQAKKGVEFKSSSILNSSQRELVYTEDIQASAGRNGSITIPTSFDLGLQPFEGSDTYKVTARLRYRITEGVLTIGYFLVDPDKVLRGVFGDMLEAIETAIEPTPILRGAPGR